MKIAIINQPTNNRGDESAHKAFIRRLNASWPQAQIEIIFIGRTEQHLASIRVEGKNNRYVNLRNWYKWYGLTEMQRKGYFIRTLWHPTTLALLWHLWRADVVMCAPGGINMGGFQSWYHIYELRLAKLLHKPIVYWGRSIGPFSDAMNVEFKRQSIKLLHYFGFVSLRDKKSQEAADELGVSYQPTVDSAFLFDFKHQLSAQVAQKLSTNYIVLVPNRLTWHYKYAGVKQENIDNFWLNVIKLIRQTHQHSQIVMLPQTFGDGALSDGYNYFCQLAQLSADDNVWVAPAACDSDEQQTIVSGAQCVIGARYHSIVFAINASVSFISLSYEHKMQGLLEMVGATSQMVDIETVFDNSERSNQALEQISKLLNNQTSEVERIRQKIMQISENCYSKLNSYLKSISK